MLPARFFFQRPSPDCKGLETAPRSTAKSRLARSPPASFNSPPNAAVASLGLAFPSSWGVRCNSGPVISLSTKVFSLGLHLEDFSLKGGLLAEL